MRALFGGRRSLWWLVGPPVVFLAALPFVNTAYLLGPWVLACTVATPVFIMLAARRDPVFRAARAAESRRRSGRGDAR
ncbi:MAG: hypothetical protein JST91_21910 [Actinobacteria bacterium]|nr:hypothetical protein [Actinomycetota bacterium]